METCQKKNNFIIEYLQFAASVSNGFALKKISRKMESLFIVDTSFQSRWFPLYIKFSLYLYAAQPTTSVYKKLKKRICTTKIKMILIFLCQQHPFELVIYTAQLYRLMYCFLLFAGSCTAPTFLQAHVLLPPFCRPMYCSHLFAGSCTAPSFLQPHVLLPPFCRLIYCRFAIMRTPGNCRGWK